MNADWTKEIFAFWFDELTEDDWFEVKPATDETIRARFLDLHASIRSGVPRDTMTDSHTALAATIVLDQFPRNMFRGTPQAFATDSIALMISRNAVDNGLDDGFGKQKRQFLYMPFMHSEIIADQERSVMLFRMLGADLEKFAIDHREIVVRFGRFPHRNALLGRESTRDERAFLQEHTGFGQ